VKNHILFNAKLNAKPKVVRRCPWCVGQSVTLPAIRWEEKAAPSAAVDPKIIKKTVKIKQKTSFKSVTISTSL
jgi:hypothetical protein